MKKWVGVGDHPTPESLVTSFADEFCKYAIEHLTPEVKAKPRINIADFFCGDGRIGNAIAKRLGDALKTEISLSFVEANPKRARAIVPSVRNSHVLIANGFTEKLDSQFDVVVSNPPYLGLDKAHSAELNFQWEEVRSGGYNLYGIAMLKCIEACRAGGVTGIIAPFGWTRGAMSSKLRDRLCALSKKIVVHALPDRSLFPSVHQDIAFQFFHRKSEAPESDFEAFFGINGHPFSTLELAPQTESESHTDIRVRIGPLVWNRTSLKLKQSNKDAILVVNGGNINSRGKLSLSDKKYKKRQYVSSKGLNSADVSHAPVLLLRRTLRGHPGSWKVDSYLRMSSFKCVAENHVIAVELPKNMKLPAAQKLQRAICSKILDSHSVSGTPNLTAKSVREAVHSSLQIVL